MRPLEAAYLDRRATHARQAVGGWSGGAVAEQMLGTKYSFTVSEADIDLLVAEECDCNPKFRSWLLERAGLASAKDELLHFIGRSISTYHGESDLLIVHRAHTGRRTAILIENKISAPPTELQAQRYRIRGEKGIQDDRWDSFVTMLIAPSKYAAHTNMVFDKIVYYEDILAALEHESEDPRAIFKNVWRAPFASGFHTVVCPVCVNVSGLRVTPRPRWRSARPGPNKSPGVDAPFFEPGFQDAGRLSGHLAFHHPQTSKAD